MNNWGNQWPVTATGIARPQRNGPLLKQPLLQNPPLPVQQNHQPLIPPQFMLPEMSMNINPAPQVNNDPNNPNSFIGPVQPDNLATVDMTMSDDENSGNQQGGMGNTRGNRHKDKKSTDKERGSRWDRDRGRSRERSNRQDRHDKSDRSKEDRSREPASRSRDPNRSNRWGDRNNMGNGGLLGACPAGYGGPMPMGAVGPGRQMGNVSSGLAPNGMMMPDVMQQYQMQNMAMGNNMPMGNSNMQMGNNMQNMMQGSDMNMQNMMGNMMNPNVMMMNNSMMAQNEPLYVTDAVLLPPIPGASTPFRREKPPGCRTIFVGGLPKGVSQKTLSEIFEYFGTITSIKMNQGVCHIRFLKPESVEESFVVSGYRFKTPDQTENEATTLFVDYALNRDDQNEFEKNKRFEKAPPRIEPFTPTNLSHIAEKIKSDDQFSEAAPTLLSWLERGECNKQNANMFYSLVQATNNQVRRLFTEKMTLDDEYHNMKAALREKFTKVIEQFEQVAKILSTAKHQRVSDHFTKQQRRNIEMWLKMTEEVENLKEEFNLLFDDEEVERAGRDVVPLEKYEKLRAEHENLMYELEGYKNEAHMAKDEAERKFEKFKAHYIAQQALDNKEKYPPLPPPPLPPLSNMAATPPTQAKPKPPPPTPDDDKIITSGPAVPPSEAKLISIVTAFLLVHPLGATLDYLVSYVRSMMPTTTQATVENVLDKYKDVFQRKTTGIGANLEHKWSFVTYDAIVAEASNN